MLYRVLYSDTVAPLDYEAKFDTEGEAVDHVNEVMQSWWDLFCKEYPTLDVVWTNKDFDFGETTEIYIPDTNINISCTMVESIPMMNVGKYLNFWTTDGAYDVFVILHECACDPTNQDIEEIENIVRDIYESGSAYKREELIAALERTDIKCINEYGVEVIVQKKED